MKFIPTPLTDACLIEMEPKSDERGFFARAFCEREFERAGLATRFCQMNTSFNTKCGTLRGMHYQLAPSSEAKIIRCVSGALYDVIADLRPDSPTFGKWHGTTLSAGNRIMLYVPHGFAHGFLTLTDATEVFYLHSAFHAPGAERGIRWDDPWLAIAWPGEPVEISAKDRTWPPFDPAVHGIENLRGLRSPAQPLRNET
jgi:dTDP-4-dehydrorhamnose 3,5-epimerase